VLTRWRGGLDAGVARSLRYHGAYLRVALRFTCDRCIRCSTFFFTSQYAYCVFTVEGCPTVLAFYVLFFFV
jgi:hypothetical protein